MTLREPFKVEPVYLTPILASLLFAVLCVSVVLMSATDIYIVAPFPEGVWSFGNALYFVILAAVGASLIYVLLKRKSLRLITLIVGFAITLAVLVLSSFYLYAAFSILAVPYIDLMVLGSSLALTVLAVFSVFKARNKASGLTILLLGGALGAFLGISIPTLSTMLILAFLAAYDIFAVYRGPVGKIASRGLDQLRGLSLSFKEVQIGLGDLTFYSMLVSRVLADAGAIFCLGSIVSLLIGVFLAFKMLEKRGIFPGLPIPIALGLIPLLTWLLLK